MMNFTQLIQAKGLKLPNGKSQPTRKPTQAQIDACGKLRIYPVVRGVTIPRDTQLVERITMVDDEVRIDFPQYQSSPESTAQYVREFCDSNHLKR